ncbi:MAG TPA: hypothetical protein VKV80_04605 [Streptosporangiaceae bacterium]|nr:hypothetical protein [Streptosporangiaceae bacterium]
MGPTEPHLRPAGGAGHAVDQVVRLRDFQAAHPEWKIGYDRTCGVWRALRLTAGGEDTTVRYVLRDLLDALGAP